MRFALVLLAAAALRAGAAVDPAPILALEGEIVGVERELKRAAEAIEAIGEWIDEPAIAAARAKVAAAEQARDAVLAPHAEARGKLEAAQAERNAAVEKLLDGAPRLRAAEARRAELAAKAAALSEAKLAIAEPALIELAGLRLEIAALDKSIQSARRAWWNRDAASDIQTRKVAGPYEAYQGRLGADKAVAAADAALKEARKALADAIAAAALAHPRSRPVLDRQAQLTAQRTELAAKLAALRKPLFGAKEWTHEVDIPERAAKDKDGKPGKPPKAHLWLPADCPRVRGLIIGHPPVLGASLTKDPGVRLAAACEGLGVILFDQLDALFDYAKDAPRILELVLASLAEASKHPELANAPLLGLGHSTSGIWARNVAYWKPERAFGVIHIKSGNLHQHRPDPARTLAGIPFIAVNGEFEEFGPEGGMKGGIQRAYGNQTQWIMIREQLLRWRAQDANHLVSLVVHPGAGHGGWASDLSHLMYLFIRKAAQARLPTGDGPCRAIALESGWLSDSDLDDPKHLPAAFAAYAGDKATAFWHFDEEMATAVVGYHRDRFLLSDPTKQVPVPAEWPPVRKPAAPAP